jgi:hypothetical protein
VWSSRRRPDGLGILCATGCGPKPACAFDIEYFFQFDDQRAVARQLRQDCARCDLDVIWNSQDLPTVFFGGAPFTPEKGDRGLFAIAASLVAQARPDSELICLLKLNRTPTFGELIRWMESGVRFYCRVPNYRSRFTIRKQARQCE